MDIRVGLQAASNWAQETIRRQTGELNRVQEQALTGKRLNRPSDGPLDMIRLLKEKSHESRLATHLSNIQAARSRLDADVSSLRDAGDIMVRAKELAQEAVNGDNDATSREAIAKDVDALLDRLLDVANSKQGDRYQFSGTTDSTAPFIVTSRDAQGRPLTVAYQGASQRDAVLVNDGYATATLYTGKEVFQGRDRQSTIYTGDTGAAAGTGTDSATGRGLLQVRHTATSFPAGSGVQAGASSAANDTILGPAGANQLLLVDTSGTGAAGTVSLNGGPTYNWTNTDGDLAVSGPNGEKVYLNLTGVTAGFNGSVAITSTGTLSVDGGASSVAINYTGNQTVTNSTNGTVTNVDSSGIRRVGDEQLDYAGTSDAFQLLMNLREDVRNTRGLTPTEQVDALNADIREADRMHGSMLEILGEQSASLQNLDGLEGRLQDLHTEAQKLQGDLEGADMAQVLLQLQAQENQLHLSLAATARMFDQSLLDFLR